MAKKTPPKNSSKEKNTLLLFSGTMLVLMYFVGHLATYDIKEKIPPKQVLAVTTEINLPELKNPSLPPPTLSAKSAYAIDLKTKKVLFAQNEREPALPASTTKIATAMVALSHYKPTDVLTIGKISIDGQKMNLVEGEQITAQDLLYGLLVFSANDAAELLAEQTTGDRTEFIKLMNEKAKQLGMKDTYFANPTGLDEDTNNTYSTVYDLAILTRYLIKHFPEVVDISSTEHIYLPITSDHQDYDMYSGINLLTTYPGVVGFKTGYTAEAGLTLINLTRKEGHEVIGVLLGSGDRRDEARDLLDYSFGKIRQ